MKKKHAKKQSVGKVLRAFFLLLAIFFIVSLVFRSPGEWVCENGAWRSVGSPRGLPPDRNCRPTPVPSSRPEPTEASSAGIPFEPFVRGGQVATDSAFQPFGLQDSNASPSAEEQVE